MGDYRELHNGTDDHHLDYFGGGASEQENFALYDPGPLEATEDSWDSWHSDEVQFNRRGDSAEDAAACCRRCIGCRRGQNSKRRCCFVFLCSTFALLIICTIIGAAIFGSLRLKASPKYDKKWYESAVGYQIFPRSFQDSDGDGVGDLKGW